MPQEKPRIIFEQTLEHWLVFLTLLLGISVIVAWCLDIEVYETAESNFEIMQIITAFGFIACAISYLLLLAQKARTAYLLALTVGFIGLSMIVRHLALSYSTFSPTTAIGNMPPSVALCFILSALAVWLAGSKKPTNSLKIIGLAVLGATILSIAIIGLFLNVVQIIHDIEGLLVIQMAASSSIGFCLIGCSLLESAYTRCKDPSNYWLWLRSMLVPLLTAILVCLFVSLQAEKKRNSYLVFEEEAHLNLAILQNKIQILSTAHARFAERWNAGGGTTEKVWRADAKAYLNDFLVYDAIAVVSVEGKIKLIDANTKNKKLRLSQLLNTEFWLENTKHAHSHRAFLTPSFSLDGKSVFLSISKVQLKPSQDGWLVGLHNVESFFYRNHQDLYHAGLQLDFVKIDDQHLLHKILANDKASKLKKNLPIFKQELSLQISATPEFYRLHDTPLLDAIVLVVALVCILLVWLISLSIKLRESNCLVKSGLQRQLNTFNSMLDALLVTDGGGNLIDANLAASEVFGYEKEELIGMDIHQLLPDSEREANRRFLKNYIPEKDSKVIGRKRTTFAIHASGKKIPIQLQVTSHYENGQRYFIGIISDLSKQVD